MLDRLPRACLLRRSVRARSALPDMMAKTTIPAGEAAQRVVLPGD